MATSEADGTPRAERGRVPDPRGRLATCPGCHGPKTPRAHLCRICRSKANALGASVITHVAEAAIPAEAAPARPRTPQQNTVYHGKVSDIAKLEAPDASKPELRLAERVVKARTLEHARTMFARQIESSTDLTEIEMELLLEWLDHELERLGEAATLAGERSS